MTTPPIIIDIEASGFGAGSYPIEVGYVTETGDAWCSLIKPEKDWLHWDEDAAKLHNIARVDLFEFGRDAETIVHHLNDVFLNKVIYSDGWMQDFTWISRIFDLVGVSPHFQLEDLRKILTPDQQVIWHATKKNVLKEMQQKRHRASADAKLIQSTWLKTAQQGMQPETVA